MKTCPSCQANYQAGFTHCPRDGAALCEVGEWHDGTLVRGKYRILGKVGEGGMAAVYKAMHVTFEEVRALKVMNDELARDRAFVKRFMHEAVLTRKLQHPSAVRVDDIDEAEDGRPFIVMEYVEGRGLKEAIQTDAPMPAGRVCPLICQVAGALDTAHRMGIVHRDVKPGNIVLVPPVAPGEPERAKLLDFGIAKAREAQFDNATRGTTLTGTGHVIGTPAYMSPEQAKGLRGDQLDGRSDLYSLGIVMYEMLLGALPFNADTSVQWILAHLQTPPRPLWEARPDLQIPYAIAGVVMRCLEKDPQNRPPNAAALIGEIEWAEQAAGIAAANPVEVGFYATAPQMPPTPMQPSRQEAAPGTVSPITARTPTQYRNDLLLGTEQKSRGWVRWLVAAIACVVLAGAVAAWRFWPQVPSPSVSTGEPTHQVPDAATSTGQGQAVSQGANSDSGNAGSTRSRITSTDANGASATTNPQSTSDGSNTVSEPSSSARTAERPDQPAEIVRKASASRRETKAVSHGSGFAEALLRARDEENKGNYEEALREYEKAAAQDPSDSALKEHIRHLREQVDKEKELIH